MTIKYPDVKVPLLGENGNAFSILGRVGKALKKAGVAVGEVSTYMDEATAGDYDNLLSVTMQWVDTTSDL